MSEMPEVELEFGEALEDGDTAHGVITGASTREYDGGAENGGSTYLDIEIEEEATGMEMSPGYVLPEKVNSNTHLGSLIERLGHDISGKAGESASLSDYISPGTMVTFEVEKVESDDGRMFTNIQKHTVREHESELDESNVPSSGSDESDESDESTDDTDGSGEGDDSDGEDDSGDGEEAAEGGEVAGEVEEFVDGYEDDEDALKKDLASKGMEHLKAYKTMKEDGDVEVMDDGDTVALA